MTTTPLLFDTAWPMHGDPDAEELAALGLDANSILDFSVCVNPCGPSPRIREVLGQVNLGRYPDRRAVKLRTALADWLGSRLIPDQILLGNGVSELIWLTCLAFLQPGDHVLIPMPTYGEYARSAAMMRARIVSPGLSAQDGFALPAQRLDGLMETHRPRMVFLCNPNNPTGVAIPAETIAGWAHNHPDCLFVIDEAYAAFADNREDCLGQSDNIVVLRSMTKDFALAGLRLGFAVGSPERIDALARVQPPWSVNAMALAAGLAALGDLAHVEKSLLLLRRAKTAFVRDLSALGLRPLPSAANFFLLPVGDGAAFRRALLEHGMLVRDCASFGLPSFVRLATRTPPENARLIEAIGGEGWK